MKEAMEPIMKASYDNGNRDTTPSDVQDDTPKRPSTSMFPLLIPSWIVPYLRFSGINA